MADSITPEKRRENMSAIRSKNTKPEKYLRKKLFAKGYRYRLYSPKVEGHPDLFLKKYNTAVFVNGCFWHRHQNCRFAYTPKSNCDFWKDKFNKNIERDLRVRTILKESGIRCLIVWECRIKEMMRDSDKEEQILDSISAFFLSNNDYLEI